MSVDPLYAQWLQAQASYTVRIDAGGAARWGATAVTSERVTGIATKAAADVEADRQLAFFARGPFAVDAHQVVGVDWQSALGRIITLTIDQLGYGGGIDVMVIGVDIDRATGLSDLTVLRPLRGVA